MPDSSKEYVLVTEYFHPDSASTGQLMTDLAVGLVDRGLDLTVYTGQPNYHSGENERQPRRTVHRGVPVRRIQAPQVRQSSLLRRLFNWTAFSLWMFATLARHRESDRELVFVSNPPFFPVVGWLLCRLKGWDYTYVVYDLYPEVIVASGHIERDGLVHRIWGRLNEAVFGDAHNVVALGPVMRDRIVETAGEGFDADTVTVIHNWADASFVRPMDKSVNPFSEAHGLVEPFSLVYSGNMGANHDLATSLRAADRFEDEPVKFLIIGEGDAKADLVSLRARLGLEDDTVAFLPYQPRDVLPYSLTSGDVSIVAVSEGMEGLCLSSKLYTALAAGQPVLVISHPEDDEARIVERHDAGIQVTQGDVEGVVAAIERWRSNPELVERQGRNARRAFENHFTKEQSVDAYYRLLVGDDRQNGTAVAPTPTAETSGDGAQASGEREE